MRKLFVLFVTVVATSCASSKQTSQSAGSTNAVVFKGSELSGSLLDGLRHRYTGMSVAQGVNGGCPMIVFRGRLSGRNQGNPSVYVDRTLMSDTCILQNIYAQDVDRVEIYPSGNVSDPAIRRNAFGVIMVFRLKD